MHNNKIKVLLLVPPLINKVFFKMHLVEPIVPPLGLASIAAVLEENNFEVKILDSIAENLSFDAVIKKILEYNPDTLGISCNVSNFNVSKKICSKLKEEKKELITVIGGPYMSDTTLDIVRDKDIDYAILGEGETSYLNLLKNLRKKKEIEGVAFLGKDKKIIYKSQKEPVDLTSLPIRAWHLLPLKKYKPSPISYKKLPSISTITSRGCPFNCIFCGTAKTRYRYTPTKKVIEELEILKSYGFKDINFWDDVFTLNKKRTIELSKEINKLNLVWNCSTRIDLIDEEVLKVMSKNGCYEIGYGIESGSQRVLDLIKKEFTINLVKKNIRLTKEYGILVKLYFMIGFPTENKEEVLKTIKLAKELDPDYVTFGLVTPIKGTPLYHITNKDIQKDYGYYSTDSINGNISTEELNMLISKAYMEYYLNLKRMTRMAMGIRSLNTLKRYYLGINTILKLQTKRFINNVPFSPSHEYKPDKISR